MGQAGRGRGGGWALVRRGEGWGRGPDFLSFSLGGGRRGKSRRGGEVYLLEGKGGFSFPSPFLLERRRFREGGEGAWVKAWMVGWVL